MQLQRFEDDENNSLYLSIFRIYNKHILFYVT